MKFVEMALHRRCTSVRFSNPPTRTPAAMVGRFTGLLTHNLGLQLIYECGWYLQYSLLHL